MKHYLACAALAAATLVLGACGAQEKETTTETVQTEETIGLKIAYVELDTLMSQYQLYKDYSEVLTRKGNNIQKTLAQKQRALENHAASIQKKYESNEFTTRDELHKPPYKKNRPTLPTLPTDCKTTSLWNRHASTKKHATAYNHSCKITTRQRSTTTS